MKTIYDHMEPYKWYVRPSGNSLQYGMRTRKAEMDFSIYLAHPSTKKQEVSWAHYAGGTYDEYEREEYKFKRAENLDNYLTLLLARKLGQSIIKYIFGE